MKVIQYNELDSSHVQKQFDKVVEALGRGDFRSADVKKLTPSSFFSAKLNDKDRVIQEHRRKRPYISSILAKNELFRDEKYNRKIFLRIARGFYIPNPHMEIEVEEDKWVNVFDLINISSLEKESTQTI